MTPQIGSTGASLPAASAGAGSSGGLPDLGTGAPAANPAVATPAAAATPGAAGATPAAGAEQASAAGGAVAPDPGAMMTKFKWLGPILAVAGAGLGAWGYKSGKTIITLSGAMMGLGGLGLTIKGFQSAGRVEGRTEGVLATEQAVRTQVLPQYDAKLKEYEAALQQAGLRLQQQAAQQAQGGGQTPGANGQTDPAANGQAPGANGQTPGANGQTPGANGQTDPAANGQTDPAAGGAATPGVTPSPTTAPQAPAIAPAQWTPQALIGQAVQLPDARLGTGASVAEAGSYAIATALGNPAGYATFDEANVAAQSTMSTEVMGTKQHRWIVLEHGGRYYAFQAQRDEVGSAPQLPAANGNLAGWHALRYVEVGGTPRWMSWHFSQTGGGAASEFAGAPSATAPATGTPTAGTPAVPVVPGAAAPGSVTGGGPTTGVSPAAALVGTGFGINQATYEGRTARGGWVQLQKLVVSSTQGFATPGEAAAQARKERSAALQPSEWQRWVTVRGADNRYYVYEAQLVNRSTATIAGGAQPMHVFGHGFAEYHDGTSWQVRSD